MTIKQLSEKAISKIAAGEVIERPLSVVKELIENSLDAQATKISIIFDRGGRSLISVSDNGTGITKDDLPIAFKRHATSKLDEEELDDIRYLGFRGEALASISIVSRLRAISRAYGSVNAWEINFDENHSSLIPAAHTQGTTIEVRDIFFSTPSRIKFLRPEKIENAACIDIVQRLALSVPNVSFNLTVNGRTTLDYKVSAIHNNHIKLLSNRVIDILSEAFLNNSVHLLYENEDIRITGFTSLPTYREYSSRRQVYCYVNNRMVKDPFLSTCIRNAYYNILPKDQYPTIVIFIEVNTKFIDVNIHPTKAQVRFWYEQKMRNAIYKAIRDSLGDDIRISSQISNKAIALTKQYPQMPDAPQTHVVRLNNISVLDNKEFTIDDGAQIRAEEVLSDIAGSLSPIYDDTKQARRNDADFKQKEIIHNKEILGVSLCQIHDKYIIAATQDCIIIVDQHAAHERLICEEMEQQISARGNLVMQPLLVPEILEVGIPATTALLSITKQLLALGLKVETYKTCDACVCVTGVPAIFSNINVKQLIYNILEDIENFKSVIDQERWKIFADIACRASIRGQHNLSIGEMNSLLRQMERTPFSNQCNHGRPTYIKLSLCDIEKMFWRR